MKRVLLVIFLVITLCSAIGQVELVPAEHRVYEFLKRMQTAGILKDYNSGVLPYSRREVASFLSIINNELSNKSSDGVMKLGRGDFEILKDFLVEFEYEIRTSYFTIQTTKNTETNYNSGKEQKEFQTEYTRKDINPSKKPRDFTTESTEKSSYELRVMSSEFKNKSEGDKSLELGKKRTWGEENKYINLDSRLDLAGMTVGFKGNNVSGKDFINDNKFIYYYTDSNATMFLNVTGELNYRNGNGDSVGNRRIGFGDIGLSFRGTLFGRIGYAMSVKNGSMFGGSEEDRYLAGMFDPVMRANYDKGTENKYYNDFRGYIRYQVPTRWLAVTVGREAIYQGFGYADKMFFSGNTVPFSFLKLDLKYKMLSYSFIYGNLNGDSAGVPLAFKTFATHRVDVKPFDWMRFGFNETVINTHSAFLFDYFNPLSFLVSADLNTGGINAYKSNSLIGIDAEFYPLRNVSIQTTLLVDDFNVSTIGKNDKSSNDNKFGYQAGVFWNSPFGVSALSTVMEYTRLDPFVYTHRYNRDQYTSYGMPLGHNLPPNSDELAWKVVYYPWKRLRLELEYQYQRSGEGYTYDSLGNMTINYGGNINHGEGYLDTIKNVFLQGDRVNRSIVTTSVYYEPVRQWFVEVKYMYRMEDLVYVGRKTKNGYLFLKLGLRI